MEIHAVLCYTYTESSIGTVYKIVNYFVKAALLENSQLFVSLRPVTPPARESGEDNRQRKSAHLNQAFL